MLFFTIIDLMASFIFLGFVAVAIGFFTLYRIFRFHQDDKEIESSSPSSSPPLPLSSSTSPSHLSRNCTHHVFPSFHGADVRKSFISHILKEFKSKGINTFIDNNIMRSNSIGPELIEAIRGSKFSIIVLSRNSASSNWCLNELVEIIKCRGELGQTVMTIFYDVDPTDVKKQTGDFGNIFRKTCKGETKENIGKWTHALAEVATIAGYHSRNWSNEAAMIEEIATDISNMLNYLSPSRDLDFLVGMRNHMENIEPLLCLDSDNVRMIGVWGPSGIGKSTITRFLFHKYSHQFQFSTIMENIRGCYSRPSSDDYHLKLQLQQQLVSQIFNHKDMKISHLGVAQERLKDKNVLVILDDVSGLGQLDALAKDNRWFGPGSRIIITTQDLRLLKTHGINHIYKVDFPPTHEALQIFCVHAFGQHSPYDGFEKLAWEVTNLVGKLPLGLKIMGSYFRGRSKQEWKETLPRLETHLDADIRSALKFSYDALDDKDQDLFLHIACLFNGEHNSHILEETLAKNFPDIRQRLRVLIEKSLIYINSLGMIEMHNLLAQLGREIVRKQCIREPGQRQFLFDAKEICEVLTDETGTKHVLGIDLNLHDIKEEIYISEGAFRGMSNLQFIKVYAIDQNRGLSNIDSLISMVRIDQRQSSYEEISHYYRNGYRLQFPPSLDKLSRKLKLLHWEDFQMTCLPYGFHTEFLVNLDMPYSNLEKLWEGIGPLRNLKIMNLSFSTNLKELPDFSTATSLKYLILCTCSTLVEIPSSIGNAINLETLDLRECTSLEKLPNSIGNATNLKTLELAECKSLVELPSSIGNVINLRILDLSGCSSLVMLPSSIGNIINLQKLDLSRCSKLVKLPWSFCNASNFEEFQRCIAQVEPPHSIWHATNLQEWILIVEKLSSTTENGFCLNIFNHYSSSPRDLFYAIGSAVCLRMLDLSGCSSLVELPSSIGNAIHLEVLRLKKCSSLVKLPSSVGNACFLQKLNLSGCSSLVELPSSIGKIINLKKLKLVNCSSLEELPSSIGNLHNLMELSLQGCSKLEVLPININLESLTKLDLTDCSRLKSFPEISTNIEYLSLVGTAIKEVPTSIKSWFHFNDFRLRMSYSENLEEFPHALDTITELQLSDTETKEIAPWIKKISRLRVLGLNACKKLVSIPHIPDSLIYLDAEDCESLERLDCSFHNLRIRLNFANCFKLNKEARDIIIQTWTRDHAVLPGGEVPAYFTHRAPGGYLALKLNQRPLPTSLRFKACILLFESDKEACDGYFEMLTYEILMDKQTIRCRKRCQIFPLLAKHLYTFEIESEEVTSSKLLFKFNISGDKWKIGECGVLQLL